MRLRHMTVPLQSSGCGTAGRATVERSLRILPGVLQGSVNPVTEMVYVEFDPAHCREEDVLTAVWRTGHGERRAARSPVPAPAGIVAGGYPVDRFALAGGLWLAVWFTIDAAGAALFPAVDLGYQLWALVLPGIGTLRWSTFPLGLVEAFVLGLFGGWLFVWVYNATPAGRARPSHTRQPMKPPVIRTRAREAM
ncbi:MAG: hypothetical protein ABI766_14475 [Gemmatimonadales bacterium]